MPHKGYHGRTGKIWNVTPRAVGVEVNKIVRNKTLVKRIHVRIEHIKPSNCRKAHEDRVKKNDSARLAWKKGGKKGPKRVFFL